MKKFAFLLAAALATAGCSSPVRLIDANQTTASTQTSKRPARVSLVAVGDALIHEGVYKDAYQKDGTYDFRPMLEPVKPLIAGYDLRYYNQETIICGGAPSTYPTFCTPDAIGDAFDDAGFNLVSLANNHTLDKGAKGVLYSVSYWQKRPHMVTHGQANSHEMRARPVLFEKNGMRFAFFSYTTATNGIPVPAGKEYLVNLYERDAVAREIAAVKDSVDAVIIAMHWGVEYVHEPNAEQLRIARELADMGVTLVLGAHPHVVQSMEWLDDTFVVYSLGNFLSNQKGEERRVGLIVGLDIVRDADGRVRVEHPRAELHYTAHTVSPARNFRVTPFSALEDAAVKSHEDKYRAIVQKRISGLKWGVK